MKKYLLIVLIFVNAVVAIGQKNEVQLVFDQVKVEVKQRNEWKQVFNGTILPFDCEIRAKGKGRLLLIKDNISGHSLKVNVFIDTVISKLNFNIRFNGFEYLIRNFANSFIHEKSRLKSSSTHKGALYINFPMLFPADDEVLAGKDFVFKWQKDSRITYDLVVCMGKDVKLLFPIQTTIDTTYCVNGNKICNNKVDLKVGENYYWTIKSLIDNPDSSYYLKFTLADNKTIMEIKKEISRLDSIKNLIDSDLFICLKATIFEQKRFYSEANNIYTQAVINSLDPSFIKTMYSEFLSRIIEKNQPE